MTKNILFGFLICMVSCIDIDESEKPATVVLFDVEQFLEKELTDRNPQDVQKEISYNGEVETSNISDYDMTEDFEVLKGVNINNPSWMDKYRIDTLSSSISKFVIQYTAIDDKLPVRSLETTMVHGEVIAFKAIAERNALVADSKKIIDYHSEKGYTISTETERLASEKRLVTITIRYNPS